MTEASFALPVPSTGDAPPVEPPIPTGTTSAMDRLRQKMKDARTQAAAKLAFRLPVPRMEMVVVEYGPVDQTIWTGILEQAEKRTNVSNLEIQARLLAQFVNGVYVLTEDGEYVSADLSDPHGPAPRFEKRLADALGIPWGVGLPWEFARTLYLTDGDLISTAAAVLDMSGYGRAKEIEAGVAGN
jgi:hypothetical protein